MNATVAEVWRPVTVYPYSKHYEVSSLGRVRRLPGKDCAGRVRPGLILRLHKTCLYLQVALFADRLKWFALVHRVVALAFLGPPPEGTQVNHKDGDKLNNRPDNLEWVTQEENQRHAVRAGLRNPENNNTTKLSWPLVREIRARRAAGDTIKSLTLQYHVSETTVRDIVAFHTWKIFKI